MILLKEKSIKVFDQEDHDFIADLMAIGIDRKQASILAFFRIEETGLSRDIEIATSMRQPEVSLAMTGLRKKGFINTEQIGRKRGQYTNEYSLAIPLGDIINSYWNAALKEWGDKMEVYKRLQKYEIRPFSG